MNRWFVAGQSSSFLVEYKKDNEFVQPDPGSIKLTIRDNLGVPMTGYNSASQPDTLLTATLLTIPQAVNVINEGRENRYIQVDYTSAGVPCVFKASYKLSPFLPIMVLPEDVRNHLGARLEEVKDEEVDLYEAYFQLLAYNPTLSAALVTTTNANMYANRAISLKAALLLLPSMPVRAMKEDTINNASAIRATIDWELLRAGLEAQLADALGNMVSPAIVFIPLPIFVKSTPIDPVTNA